MQEALHEVPHRAAPAVDYDVILAHLNAFQGQDPPTLQPLESHPWINSPMAQRRPIKGVHNGLVAAAKRRVTQPHDDSRQPGIRVGETPPIDPTLRIQQYEKEVEELKEVTRAGPVNPAPPHRPKRKWYTPPSVMKGRGIWLTRVIFTSVSRVSYLAGPGTRRGWG